MVRAHVALLGGLDIAGDAPAAALTRKARALVAYLAMQSGHSQSREKLAALLWGGNGEVQARTNLRQALSVARKALAPSGEAIFLTDGDNVALNLDDFDFDVARFEALAAGSDHAQLEQAMHLYRGDLLDGFSLEEEPFEDWVRVERERLRAIAIGALEKLVSHYAATNNPAHGIQAATRLLALEPLREDVHRALMRNYATQDRVPLALKQYEICSEALQRELGVRPERETQSLYEDLRARRAGSDKSTHTRGQGAVARPQTHYVKSAGCNIAYQVTGDGPIDMVYVQGWVTNVDYAWTSPRLAHVLDRLGSFTRLIRFDKRGTGLSDRGVGLPTLEQRMEDMRAVLDSLGSKRAVLFGSSEGGNMCMLFAATYPERTAALVLNGSYARGLWSEDYPWARTRDQVEEDLARIEREWGKLADLSNGAPSLMNDTFEREWFASYMRNSASPADAIALWRWGTEIDVRDILPAIRVPTLIVQRLGDRWVKVEEGRYLAAHIAGAKYVELAGSDHIIWGHDSDRMVDEIRNFLTNARTSPPMSGYA